MDAGIKRQSGQASAASAARLHLQGLVRWRILYRTAPSLLNPRIPHPRGCDRSVLVHVNNLRTERLKSSLCSLKVVDLAKGTSKQQARRSKSAETDERREEPCERWLRRRVIRIAHRRKRNGNDRKIGCSSG
jgi:hypothetical protein